MEKGDKPKLSTFVKTGGKPAKQKKPSASLMKQKKPAKEKKQTKQKQKQKQKQENVQIVKVNVNTSKEEKPPAKPVRKEITKQTTYVTLDKPYALQPEEEELLTITKHIPNPPRDKSRAKVTTLVSDPKNEIPQPNIQEQPIQVPIPIKKKVTAKKKGLFDVPVEIYVGAKAKQSSQTAQALPLVLDEPEPEILKVIPQKKPRKLKQPKYDVPVEIFEPKKRTVGKTVIFGEGSVDIFDPKTLAKTTEEEQALVSVAEEVTTKKGKRQKVKEIIPSTNSSSIDKSIQNSSINNNEKVQELVLAEPTVSEKKTGLIISPKLKMPIEQEEEEVIKERTPIPTKLELKKQELRQVMAKFKQIYVGTPSFEKLKDKRDELISDIKLLKELETFVTETVPKIQVKETLEEVLTKIEKPDLEEEVFDYISNADDANISNPNSGEKINIQNENELEEEFGLTSAQVESYKEDYVMTAKGSVEGLSETIEKKKGRPSKYASEEERKIAIKEQKKASSIRIREEEKRKKKALTQIQTDIDYEEFIQGNYPPVSLEEMLLKDIVVPEKEFSEGFFASMSAEDLGQNLGQDIVVSSTTKSGLKKTEKPDISSDFASALVDKLSDNNNFGSIQSAQESQFDFE